MHSQVPLTIQEAINKSMEEMVNRVKDMEDRVDDSMIIEGVVRSLWWLVSSGNHQANNEMLSAFAQAMAIRNHPHFEGRVELEVKVSPGSTLPDHCYPNPMFDEEDR